jgi:hypothetical protein
MDVGRKVIIVPILSLLVALVTASCGSGSESRTTALPTIQDSEGLGDVRSPACTPDQLRQVSRSTPRTRIHLHARLGVLNTRKTAVRIKLDTLLVVTIKERDTGHLATSTGCWVRRESHVRRRVMTVVFLMNHTGYPVVVSSRSVPPGAEDVGADTYLHVVRQ